ncbi:MAG: DUF2723 domain-containing protein [Chloroflexota bacterium]
MTTDTQIRPHPSGRTRGILFGAVFLSSLVVYLSGLSPTVQWGDPAELATGAYTLGIVHPTGYPLYLLLGKLFTFLPFGDIAYRLNMMSAVAAAAASGVLALAVVEMTRRPVLAFVAGLSFAFTPVFWHHAMAAEKYSLHGLFVALILWLVLVWRRTGQARYFVLLSMVVGLSLAHHRMTVLLAPGLVFAFFALGPWRSLRPRHYVAAAALFLIGPLLYLYIPIRDAANPALNIARFVGVDVQTPQGFLWYISGALFQQDLSLRPVDLWNHLELLGTSLVKEYSLVLVALALIGVYGQNLRDRRLLLTLALFFGANLAFDMVYQIVNISDYFFVLTLLLTVWAAEGLDLVITLLLDATSLGTILASIARRASAADLAHLALVPLPVILLLVNRPALDASSSYAARDVARSVMVSLPKDAVIFVLWPWANLWYVQSVEGLRPDVSVVDVGLYSLGVRTQAITPEGLDRAARSELVHKRLNELIDSYAQRPRFAAFYLAFLPERYGLVFHSKVGPVFKVEDKGPPLVRQEDAATREFSGPMVQDALELIRAEAGPADTVAGGLVRAKLTWRVHRSVPKSEDLGFLLAPNGKRSESFGYRVRQGYGVSSPEQWPAGAIVEEYYDVFIPLKQLPGRYDLLLTVLQYGEKDPRPIPMTWKGQTNDTIKLQELQVHPDG